MKHPKSYDSTAETRKRMSHVKLKKGYEEVVLAKALWHKGYRYRLNYKGLPGSPDIAIIKYKVAIFVDGEFWHGYKWDEKKDKIKRNREYWIQKIEENMARDSRVDEELKAMPCCFLPSGNAAIRCLCSSTASPRAKGTAWRSIP